MLTMLTATMILMSYILVSLRQRRRRQRRDEKVQSRLIRALHAQPAPVPSHLFRRAI